MKEATEDFKQALLNHMFDDSGYPRQNTYTLVYLANAVHFRARFGYDYGRVDGNEEAYELVGGFLKSLRKRLRVSVATGESDPLLDALFNVALSFSILMNEVERARDLATATA